MGNARGQDARAPLLEGSVAVPAAPACGQDARDPFSKV
jgi:hypothetical protein